MPSATKGALYAHHTIHPRVSAASRWNLASSIFYLPIAPLLYIPRRRDLKGAGKYAT